MSKNHLKRLNAPRSWPISRKGTKWVTKQNPGPHKTENSIPLNLVLKNLLKYAKTTREVKTILNNKEVLIDKIVRKDIRFPVGMLDVIEIPKLKEHFLFLISKKGKFLLKKINEKEAETKYFKITGKKILKKKRLQINFYNGNNIISEDKNYRVGDTLIISLKDKKIMKHLKLEKGSAVYITGGKYIGETGIIEKLPLKNESEKDIIEIKIDKKLVKTLKEYTFVVDDTFAK